MYARIELMGHAVIYGRVRPSRLPGLIQVDSFFADGNQEDHVHHLGPGAIFEISEMDEAEAVDAWLRRFHTGRKHSFSSGCRVYLKPIPEPAPESFPVLPLDYPDTEPEAPKEPPPFDDDVPF